MSLRLRTWTFTVIFFLFHLSALAGENDLSFEFVLTADMRNFAGPEYQNSNYFLGVCQAIDEVGKGAFMISPGDIDPPWHVRETLAKVLGDQYIWYPVVGNHESETPEDMDYLRKYNKQGDALPHIVRKGPA